jgi:putative transposase
VLAAISRAVPRARWSCFVVRPETLLGWHRRLVTGAWTYPHRGTGRPPLDQELPAADRPLGHREPALGLPAHQGRAAPARHAGLGNRDPRHAASSWAGPGAAADDHDLAAVPAPAGGRHPRLRLVHRRHHLAAAAVGAVFIELATRRVQLAGVTSNPDGAWVTQQACNLFLATADGLRLRVVLRDRDAKFCHGFDEVFRAEGAEVVVTPVQAPNANAFAERWIRTVRAECLDWLLIIGRGHLEQVLRIYVEHDNQHRHTERLGSNRLVHPPVGPWSVRLGEPGCADATSLVACFMSTGELHERLYAPYGPARPPMRLWEP